MKLAVVLIHGIGGSTENWAEEPIWRLNEKILTQVKVVLKDKAPTDVSEVVLIKSVYWKTVLEKPENDLKKVLAKYFSWVLKNLIAALSSPRMRGGEWRTEPIRGTMP